MQARRSDIPSGDPRGLPSGNRTLKENFMLDRERKARSYPELRYSILLTPEMQDDLERLMKKKYLPPVESGYFRALSMAFYDNALLPFVMVYRRTGEQFAAAVARGEYYGLSRKRLERYRALVVRD